MAQAYKRHCDRTTDQPGQKRKVSLRTDQPAKATTSASNKDKMDMPMNMAGMSGM